VKHLLLFILLTQTALAQDVVYLDKGQAAPQAGYLFAPRKEKEVRLKLEELDYCDKSKELLRTLNGEYKNKDNLLEQRLDLRNKEIDNLSKQVAEQNNNKFLLNFGFFSLGIAVTTAVVYGVSRALGK